MGLPHAGVTSPIPKQTEHLIAALGKRGVEVETFGWSRRQDNDSAAKRVIDRLADAWRVRRRLASGRFDVLVVMTAHNLTGVMRDLPLSVLTSHRVPVRVLQFHGSDCDKLVEPGNHALKIFTRLLIKNWAPILVLSHEERRQWLQFAPGAVVRVTSNPYVRTMFRPTTDATRTANDRTGGAGYCLTVLFVGRLLTQKGVFDLVEAFGLARREVDCSLVMVGDGPEREALSQSVERAGLTPFVKMPGWLAGDDLREAYLGADVFVLPSYREGFPTVIAEAMDAGLPIITTEIRGAADILEQETNVLFVPPGQPEFLAQSLVRLLKDDGLREHMGTANAQKVTDFEPGAVADQFIELLKLR